MLEWQWFDVVFEIGQVPDCLIDDFFFRDFLIEKLRFRIVIQT